MSPIDTSPENRDAVTLRILGGFFLVMGALVLLATCWTLGNFRALIVNSASGLILIGVGVGMVCIAQRLGRSSP